MKPLSILFVLLGALAGAAFITLITAGCVVPAPMGVAYFLPDYVDEMGAVMCEPDQRLIAERERVTFEDGTSVVINFSCVDAEGETHQADDLRLVLGLIGLIFTGSFLGLLLALSAGRAMLSRAFKALASLAGRSPSPAPPEA